MDRKRSRFWRRLARALLLGQVLPTLILTPSQAKAVLLHSHCDQTHHLHVLNHVETTAWIYVHGSEHQSAGEGADECCETSEPIKGPDGIVLHRPPILVCRARLIETAPLQASVDAVFPEIAAACAPALVEPAETPRERCAPRRCLDALLSGSHALLI